MKTKHLKFIFPIIFLYFVWEISRVSIFWSLVLFFSVFTIYLFQSEKREDRFKKNPVGYEVDIPKGGGKVLDYTRSKDGSIKELLVKLDKDGKFFWTYIYKIK